VQVSPSAEAADLFDPPERSSRERRLIPLRRLAHGFGRNILLTATSCTDPGPAAARVADSMRASRLAFKGLGLQASMRARPDLETLPLSA